MTETLEHRSLPAALDGGTPTAEVDRVQSLFADSPDAVLLIEAAGVVAWGNAAATALIGAPAAVLPGLEVAQLLPVLASPWEHEASVFLGGTTGHATTWLRRIDGERVPVATWPLALSDQETGTTAILLRPLPARLEGEPAAPGMHEELQAAQANVRSANRALRESEERFRGAFDGASIGMALVARDGRFLQVNRALCGIVGYSEGELLSTTFPAITVPDDALVDDDQARQLLADEITSYQIEKGFVCKDGTIICGRLTVSLVRDAAGEPLYFVCQVQDVTPYKAAGRALREAEARYRALVEQIPAVVYVDRPEALGSSFYVSPRVEALLGYTPEEWLATPTAWSDYVHLEDRERLRVETARANADGMPVHIEYRFLARDGRVVWVRDTGELIRDEDGVRQYWQGFFVDITDRKLAEEQLRAAKDAAEEASRLKSAFLSMATHELRTPLTIISGYVELLAASDAEFSSEEREFLDMVQTSARSLAALVNDLLDLARIEAGRLELETRAVDVAQTAERVRRMVTVQAASKGIGLIVSMPPGLPRVAADPDRLFQVLLNLVGNAIKFTEDGHVRIAARAVSGGVEIAVTDTGIGIAAQALPRIFDEFRQADVGTTRKFGGSGLGLAIAKRLVEMHAGTIGVTSELGVGSNFTVWIPEAGPGLPRDDGKTAGRQDGASRSRQAGKTARWQETGRES